MFIQRFSTLLFLLNLTNSFHTCEENCINSFNAPKICANNGKIYRSECHALCDGSGNKKLFSCLINSTDFSCEQQCKENHLGINPSGLMPTCENACSGNSITSYICANNGEVYQSLCHAKCSSSTLSRIFGCHHVQYLALCKIECKKRTNTLTFQTEKKPQNPFIDKHKKVMPTEPLIQNSNCKFEDLICASDGNVYQGKCSDQFISNLIQPRFNCSENSFYGMRKCRKLCSRFANSPCITQCFKNKRRGWGRRKGRGPKYKCYSNGRVMKDRCLSSCLNLETVFRCHFNEKRCRRKCKRNRRGHKGGHKGGHKRGHRSRS